MKYTVCWPGINQQIEDIVKGCQECQESLPLIPHEIPQSAQNMLRMQVFYIDIKSYLCVIDYLSKFPVIRGQRDYMVHVLIHVNTFLLSMVYPQELCLILEVICVVNLLYFARDRILKLSLC